MTYLTFALVVTGAGAIVCGILFGGVLGRKGALPFVGANVGGTCVRMMIHQISPRQGGGGGIAIVIVSGRRGGGVMH